MNLVDNFSKNKLNQILTDKSILTSSNNSSKNEIKSSNNIDLIKSYLIKNQNKVSGLKSELLNRDSNPIVISKKPTEKLEYTQKIAIRYLKPPPLPPPGR